MYSCNNTKYEKSPHSFHDSRCNEHHSPHPIISDSSYPSVTTTETKHIRTVGVWGRNQSVASFSHQLYSKHQLRFSVEFLISLKVFTADFVPTSCRFVIKAHEPDRFTNIKIWNNIVLH